MSFDQAAVTALVGYLESLAIQTNVFRTVNFHEAFAAPSTGLHLEMWVNSIEPLGTESGLDAGSGYVIVFARAKLNTKYQPRDDIDPEILTAMTTLIAAYSADFDLGGSIRNIDIFGMAGQKLSAQAGYVSQDGNLFRMMTLTIPCIINDMWSLSQ